MSFMNKMLASACLSAMVLVVVPLFASDQIPGKPQSSPVAIVGATIHTVSGDTMVGSLVFENGQITAVGPSVNIPAGTEIIQAAGKHLFPSLIEAQSDIGLTEIDSISSSIDSSETGTFNPNVRSAVAFNPDSELIPVARANGVLLAVSAPSGRLLAGRSSLMMLDGWTWEGMSLLEDVGMQLRWPGRESDIRELDEFLLQAKRYGQRLPDPTSGRDLRLEAMAGVLSKKIPLIVTANSIDEIHSSVAFANKHQLRMIIHGGAQAPECAELLLKYNIPVIVSGTYRTPQYRNSSYDESYTLPARLHACGLQFCISAGNRFGASMMRNLPYHAATAAAYGLNETVALRSITLSPAEILGASEKVGSLEVGKDATLFIADGDILEVPTQVELAYIQGREVDLSSKHTQLFHKYSQKYGAE
ncbi:MAG: amidohydrolase family protein [Planctomycetales bacterium]|nr:amidohydrolase family protein [Planctomycetales bacterium]